MTDTQTLEGDVKTAVFAGGCFWCVEADLQKRAGVIKVVSGYMGGTNENPTYENYSKYGHREVVEVRYDPNLVSFKELVRYLIAHIDPTDAGGSFGDRGDAYTSAIYFETEEEKKSAEEVLKEIGESGVYQKPIVTPVLARSTFWPAEEYHQDYSEKNPLKYGFYRTGSGRDAFVGEYKDKVEAIAIDETTASTRMVRTYSRPAPEEIKKKLTPLQFNVTQEEGTEPPFQNEYHDSKADGIYVDILSGEPLFSSRDKFDSGTGWPSFIKPIEKEAVTEHEDRTLLFQKRVEVRSRYADSHLGHVFPDGPQPTGLRYCMNSAALRFVPKEKLEEEGYGEYVKLFN